MLEVAIQHELPATTSGAGFTLDLGFDVPDQGITALFGASGAGKTSVLNAIAGLITPAQGRITVGSTVLFDSSSGVRLPPERRGVGYVFQEPRLFPHLLVRDNLLYGARRARRRNAEPAQLDEVVALLGIDHLLPRRPGRLSGGERQRVAIGRALLSSPRVLLLDEPLSGLDVARQQEILPYLERLRDELKIPMVYVSHAYPEVMRLASNVVVLADGRVKEQGAPAELSVNLALGDLFGEPAAVFEGHVARDLDAHLCEVDCGGLTLVVPRASTDLVRVMVSASDVTLALTEPSDLSANNVLRGTIEALHDVAADPQSGQARFTDVRLDVAGHPMVARVTGYSRARLALKVGAEVYAIVKTVKVIY